MSASPVGRPPQRFDLAAFFFNAAGRSGRTAALLGLVAVAILIQPLTIIPPGWVHQLYGWTIGFLAFVVWATVMARRLHDLGKAGWWIAPFFALAWLSSITAPPPAWLGAAFGFAAGAIQVGLLLWPGERRFNRFGPPPA